MQAGDEETCGLILLEFFITMLWQIRSQRNLPKEENNKRQRPSSNTEDLINNTNQPDP